MYIIEDQIYKQKIQLYIIEEEYEQRIFGIK